MNSLFKIEPVGKENIEGVATVIATEFCERQISSEYDTSYEEFKEYLVHAAQECASDQLGFAARSNETNEIVGAVVACDLADTMYSEEFIQESENDPMISMLYNINKDYFSGSHIEKGVYLNVKFLAVSQAFSGKGIVNELLTNMLDVASSRKFKYAHTEAAGDISQYVFMNRHGFEEKSEIIYDDYVFKGKKPYTSSEHNKSIKLLIKEL